MNKAPTDTSPTQVIEPELNSIFVSFRYSGKDNGMPKEGFDSRILKIPSDVKFQTAEDLQDISNALATSEFQGNKRYADLEIVLLNVIRLPI